MVSVQLAFRIWIMWCRSPALAPWGGGLGARPRRTPHRDPWVRGRWESSRFSRVDHWESGGCFAPRHHTSVCERKLAKNVQRDSEKRGSGWLGWRDGRGVGVAEATTLIVAELRHFQSQRPDVFSGGKKNGARNKTEKKKQQTYLLKKKTTLWAGNK